jgi:hypothetical protein
MRRLAGGLLLATAIGVAACSVAGCGSGSPIAKLTPSRSISVPSGGAASILPSATPSILPSATPSILPSTSVPATPTAQPSATHSAAASVPVAQPSGSPASSSGTSSLIWLWIVLGALVLIGLIIWIATAARRRSAATAGWRSKVIDAYAKGAALHDAMSVAEGPGGLAAEDAGARWSDIQRRADDLAQTLYAMREAAPNEDDRARVADVLAALQAVRSGMDAERAPGGASMRQADVVRGRLRAFEAALRRLRAPDDGVPDGGMPY